MKLPINEIRIKPGRRAVDDSKVRELADSMKQVGLINPVTVNTDLELIAGAHRIAAAELLGWDEIEARMWDCDAFLFELAEIDENLMRNELHSLIRGNSINRREELLKQAGLMAERGRPVKYPESGHLMTVPEIAKSIGISKSTLFEEKRISAAIPEDVQEVIIKADLTKEDTKRIAKLPHEEQRKVASEINAGASSLIDARRRIKREEVHSTPELKGKYRVIYADPPWAYTTQLSEGYGSVQNHYPTMTDDELLSLPVAEIADENSIIYLWATSLYLPLGIQLLKTWGFNYKGSFVWDKVKHNMGNYNSVRHEFLLFGTKGSCLPEVGKLFDSVVSEERTEHSVKPETFRTIIETLYPTGKKVELFSRSNHDGWESWGNQS